MTARDGAIAAMAEANATSLALAGSRVHLESLLDAIPDDVLVRLAVERGALVPAEWVEVGDRTFYTVVMEP